MLISDINLPFLEYYFNSILLLICIYFVNARLKKKKQRIFLAFRRFVCLLCGFSQRDFLLKARLAVYSEANPAKIVLSRNAAALPSPVSGAYTVSSAGKSSGRSGSS